jgi:hypothetical protein
MVLPGAEHVKALLPGFFTPDPPLLLTPLPPIGLTELSPRGQKFNRNLTVLLQLLPFSSLSFSLVFEIRGLNQKPNSFQPYRKDEQHEHHATR